MSEETPEAPIHGVESLKLKRCRSVPIEDNSMGASLHDYVISKIHPDIQNSSCSRVIVRTPYTRDPPAHISRNEKKDKPFNWQRPTTIAIDSTTIQLNCFPGKDYVKHYAALVATYYALENRSLTTVQYSPPVAVECIEAFLSSNLSQMGHIDIVVVGYVHHLGLDDSWEGCPAESNNLFAWQKPKRTDGVSVSFLGCMVSFWGDISGHLVRALQVLNNVKCVLYIGKTGALSPESEPNRWLATGDRSFLEGRLVEWENVLQRSVRISPRVHDGTHITVSTLLCETEAWLNEWQPRCSWVDCEVGHMAQASSEGRTAFAYLHIVSDNIAIQNPQNLSNERLDEVVSNREHLFRDIRSILESFFASWPSHASRPSLDGPTPIA